MSEANFTKGEWVVDEEYFETISVVVMDDDGDGCYIVAENVDEYDAHIIAAAPDMYELLETIENDDGKIPEWLWGRIQAVKEKARGEK